MSTAYALNAQSADMEPMVSFACHALLGLGRLEQAILNAKQSSHMQLLENMTFIYLGELTKSTYNCGELEEEEITALIQLTSYPIQEGVEDTCRATSILR